jgi:hypothetical protein
MARRRRRRSRSKRKRPSLILIVALVVLAAGFITRRVLAPRAMHFLTHRSATFPPPTATVVEEHSNQDHSNQLTPPGPTAIDGVGERLTNSDRRALDQVVRQRSGR